MPGPSVPIESLLAHREWVRGLARSLVRDPSAADDLEQEAWLAALRHPPRSEGSLRGWFGTLLRSRARDSWRGENRRAARESSARPVPPAPSPEEIVCQAEAHRRVVDAVLALEEPYRATVLLCYFEGLPPREVSERMVVPLETVRTRLRRALDRLRERFDREEDGDRSAWIAALLPLAGGDGTGLPPPPVPRGGNLSMPSIPAIAGAAAALLAAGGVWLVAGRDSPGAPRTAASGGGADGVGGRRMGAAPAPAAALPPVATEEAGPPGTPPAEPAPPGPADGSVAIRVFDLADGGSAAGVAFVTTLPDGSSLEATTDGVGFVQLPVSGLRKVLPRDGDWRSPVYAEGEILASREIWIYRMIRVEGEVRFQSEEGGANPASVALSCTPADRSTLPWEGGGQGPPRDFPWLRKHGLEVSIPLPSPDVDGSFFARVPRIRGARIHASMPGWISDAALVPEQSPGTEPVKVDLVLREARRVTGVLRDGDGNPVAGVRVEFHLTMRLSTERAADLIPRLRPRGGFTARTNGNESIVSFVDGQSTGKDGTFDFPALATGAGLLFVPPTAGHGPTAAAVGAVGETSVQKDLVMDRLDETVRVRLMKDGTPVCSTALTVIDLSCGDAQPSFGLSTDERGEVAAGILQSGHRYMTLSQGAQSREDVGDFVWKGESGEFELKGAPKVH